MKIIAVIAIVITLLAGTLGVYSFVKAKSCLVVNNNVTEHCGVIFKSPDGKSETYLAKIDGFENDGTKEYILLNFGATHARFPVGENNVDKILLKEDNERGLYTDANTTAINIDFTKNISNKYSGRYVKFFLPTSLAKADRLVALQNFEIKSDKSKFIYDREIAFWMNCPQQLDRLSNILKENSVVGEIYKKYLDLTDKNFSKCLPIISTLIFI